ncbi:phosphoglycerate mutase (2,3-diphosphoglycerate-independent) [bacterium M21]|nr:phosphoglycerate mutase (2,3-diphosphoglycerate-independent) [bacterium M21]
MMETLSSLPAFGGRRGPLVLCIMDGIGYGTVAEADAVQAAYTPNLDWLHDNCPSTKLKAHGKAVGLPSDADMGNSEVGHNAIGCGRVFSQGAMLVNAAIESGAMFKGETWTKQISNVIENDSSLHFLGLFSDGNVHSHIDHLKAMINRAAADGVKKVRVHILLDGRDVGETSALDYVDPFEEYLAGHVANGLDYCIASGGGRMYLTMDRYGADWSMVQRGWDTHVKAEGRQFASAREAIETYRSETGVIDQDMHEFIIAENGQPMGPVVDGDSFIFFNFRGDRSIEISTAFDADECPDFNRGPKLNVAYSGMMEYDGDLHVPNNYLVTPPAIDRTMGEFLANAGVSQYAISETQKFGHVTYFFNGNKSGKFNEELETYVEIPSDVLPFEQRPWMKGAEITDEVLKAIESGDHQFIRLNFPNGDMVGHTGVFAAAIVGVETVDLSLGRIMKAVKAAGGILVISADHGNGDEMYEFNKKSGEIKMENGKPKAKTSHTLNPVPCLIFDPESKNEYTMTDKEGLGISSLAATCLNFLGFEAPEDYDESVLKFK